MTTELYEDEKLSPEEQNVGSGKALRYLLPLVKQHWRSLLVCFALLVGATVLSLFWPVLLKRAFDVNLAARDFRGLIITTILIGLLQGTALFLNYLQRVRLEIIGQSVMVKLKTLLFDHILSLDVSFFDRHPVGRLMARVESDTEALRTLFTMTAVALMGDVLLVIGTFSLMFATSWRLALLLVGMMPLVIGMIILFERKTTPRFLEVRKKMAEVVGTLTEFIQGMAIVQIFHRGQYARKRLYDVSKQKFRNDAYAELSVVAFFNTINFLQYLMTGLVLLVGIPWTRTGAITVGTMSMFIILIWRSFEPLYRVSEQLSSVQKAIAGVKRMYALLSTKPKLLEPVHPVAWPKLQQGIQFENVWFSYTDDDNWTLRDINFEIPVGKRVALAGVTGGGKSTVINLLLRFYDPQRGRITVDGTDIREISQEELRRRFALVLQDIHLFPGDVRSNISLETAGIQDEQIATAARAVDAHAFIDRLPNNYRTVVSEKGANFSRGERQLLSFARALVVNPDVLILDEATSSVDPETERTIQASLKVLMAQRTSLIIAHRVSTILDVGQILVIRRGEIVERGTHTELILQDGYYSKLFHLQFKSRNGVATNA
ncbi:MAG: ABC transporter ATP-binding protein [Candidatus Zixiibacteriota bacterium]